MQSANDAESLLEAAIIDLDAIVEEADPHNDVQDATLNIRAAMEQRELQATEELEQSELPDVYLEKAREHIVALCASLDYDGPYHQYAQRAKKLLRQVE